MSANREDQQECDNQVVQPQLHSVGKVTEDARCVKAVLYTNIGIDRNCNENASSEGERDREADRFQRCMRTVSAA